jgi:hypothetical protein
MTFANIRPKIFLVSFRTTRGKEQFPILSIRLESIEGVVFSTIEPPGTFSAPWFAGMLFSCIGVASALVSNSSSEIVVPEADVVVWLEQSSLSTILEEETPKSLGPFLTHLSILSRSSVIVVLQCF